jgi:hypothetical protein
VAQARTGASSYRRDARLLGGHAFHSHPEVCASERARAARYNQTQPHAEDLAELENRRPKGHVGPSRAADVVCAMRPVRWPARPLRIAAGDRR